MSIKKMIEGKCENCNPSFCCKKWGNGGSVGSCGGAVYVLGIFGVAFYFFSTAFGAVGFAMAILKSLIWPALPIYQALSLLKL